jgi:single-stranded-DNA-specific exonuclease
VGHNSIEFDMKFMNQALKKHMSAWLNNPVDDTLKMAHVMLKKLGSYGLNSVAQYLGVFVDTKTLHRALADSCLCAHIYRRLMIGRTNRVMELYQELLPLAAVGTIADIMPLVDENRNIVKNGLRFIPHTSIGLIYLIREVKLSLDHISSRDISWNISPLLNSPGRMGNASISVELLISNKIKETEELVHEIVQRDSARKNVMDDGVDLVNTMVDPEQVKKDKIIFFSSKDFTRGTTGLLANRLTIEHRVPAMVVSIDGAASSGSIRSVSGFDVVALLEKMSNILIQYGGHKAAGGFTVKTDQLENLKAQLLKHMENIDLTELKEEIRIDAVIENMNDLNINLVRYLENVLEPTGNSNEIPRALVRRVKIVNFREIGKAGGHALMTVQKDGKDLTVVGWNWIDKLRELFGGNPTGRTCDIVGTPEINKFQGNEELRLNLIDVQLPL